MSATCRATQHQNAGMEQADLVSQFENNPQRIGRPWPCITRNTHKLQAHWRKTIRPQPNGCEQQDMLATCRATQHQNAGMEQADLVSQVANNPQRISRSRPCIARNTTERLLPASPLEKDQSPTTDGCEQHDMSATCRATQHQNAGMEQADIVSQVAYNPQRIG